MFSLVAPDDFLPIATVRDLASPEALFEKHGLVVVYEKGGERKLVGYIDADGIHYA